MLNRLWLVATNTFREAVRDRILYNLIAFALLLVAAAPLFGQISIGLERIVLINLGLTAITLFGVVIAILVGIGLVSKEIDRRTLYTVLARPVQRWEFILGKYLGLAGTLVINATFMAAGLLAVIVVMQKSLGRPDAQVLVAVYLIVLQFLVITSITLLFSSFSSPLLSAIFAFGVFVIGNFVDDLRGFGMLLDGFQRWLVMGMSYLVPNFGAMNVVASVAHGDGPATQVVLTNTLYALIYVAAALSGTVLIFDRRDLK
jgi:ABC-type transport system involved in multi-copper enzyme maturation permease subunit